MSCIRRGHACALLLLLTAHAPAQVDASLSWPAPSLPRSRYSLCNKNDQGPQFRRLGGKSSVMAASIGEPRNMHAVAYPRLFFPRGREFTLAERTVGLPPLLTTSRAPLPRLPLVIVLSPLHGCDGFPE